MGAPLLSVVVPTRNEADNLGPLCSRLSSTLDGLAAEICFVDDSDDATSNVLRTLAEESNGRIRVLLREGNERIGGLSTAVVAGLHLARGHYVCVMDADLQHPPELIPAMLEAAEAGADLVVASRYVPGASAQGLASSSRRLVSRAAGALARLLFTEARRSRDPLSGFFLCRRSVVEGIEFRPVGFKVLLELLVCVPGLRVVDVPLDFQPRAAGASKASLRQGALYLLHLRSLIFDVDGSARFWKFATVGISGLGLFLPLLWVLSGPGHVHPLLAFLPAFLASLIWNTLLNRLWTFADQRRTSGPRRHFERALISGVAMYAAYAGLLHLGVTTVTSGLLAAILAMATNGVVSRRSVRDAASPWARLALEASVQASLHRLGARVGADRVTLLPPRPSAESGSTLAELGAGVIRTRRAVLWTAAPSYRPQRRSNIELDSRLLIPVVRGTHLLALVVCERHAARSFDAADLETAVAAAPGIGELLSGEEMPGVDAASPSRLGDVGSTG